MHIDLRKYNFYNRVINVWNSLPDDIVLSNSVNEFKNKLDNFWVDEDMLFNPEYDFNKYVYKF